MGNGDWIKLNRNILKWEWYDDLNVRVLFIHCLLRANFDSQKWQGVEIKKGQFVTSYNHLSKETGLTYRQVRYSLDKLRLSGELSHERHSSYSIITVNNWNKWQANWQSDCHEIGNNKRNKEIKNINPSYINSSSSSLSREDEEILKKLAEKNNVKYFKCWLRKIIKNGDYISLLEKEKKRLQAREGKKGKITEDFKKVNNKLTACMFIGKYGNFDDENNPKEVIEVMKRFEIDGYTHATEFIHKSKKS